MQLTIAQYFKLKIFYIESNFSSIIPKFNKIFIKAFRLQLEYKTDLIPHNMKLFNINLTAQ